MFRFISIEQMVRSARWSVRQRGKLILLIVVAIAGLSIGLAVRHMRDNKPVANPPVVNDRQFKAMAAYLAPAQQMVADGFTDYASTTTIWAAENTAVGTSLAADGYTFRIASTSEPTLLITPAHPVRGLSDTGTTFVPTHTTNQIYTQIASSLTSQGFYQHPLPAGAGAPVPQNNFLPAPLNHILTKGNITCTIVEDAAYYSLRMTCYDPGAVTFEAAQMHTFATLFASGTHTPLKSLTVGPLSIKSQSGQITGPITSSKTPGYDLAEAVVQANGTKQVALYYAKGGSWHFITAHSDEWGFDCAPIFKDPDARKAMYSQVCYDYAGTSGMVGQIRVDSSARALP